jgi:hypothetical protein
MAASAAIERITDEPAGASADFITNLRNSCFNPNSYYRNKIPDGIHDLEGGALERPRAGGSSYLEFGANIVTILGLPDTARDIRTLNNLLLTANGAAKPEAITAHMEGALPSPFSQFKVATIMLDDLATLTQVTPTNPTPILSNISQIVQDSINSNPFRSKKNTTNPHLIGAGRGAASGTPPLQYIDNLVTKLDGATKLSQENIGNTEYTEQNDPFPIHMFLAGYRHTYRVSPENPRIFQIVIERVEGGGAVAPVCVISCTAGISVNAVCAVAGIPLPRGEGTVGKPVTVAWNIPEANRDYALIVYVKTLTDWAQIYYCSLYGAALVTVDTFALRAAWWLRTPVVILMKKGYCEIYVYDPRILNLNATDKITILNRFLAIAGLPGIPVDGRSPDDIMISLRPPVPAVGWTMNPTPAQICGIMVLKVLTDINQITPLASGHNVLSYLINIEVRATIASIATSVQTLLTDVGAITSIDWWNPATVDTRCRQYLALKEKGFYSVVADMFRRIQDVTDKYLVVHRKLNSLVPRWRVGEVAIGNVVAIMQSVIQGEQPIIDQIIGAWLTYLPLTAGTFNRNQAILKVRNELGFSEEIMRNFIIYSAVHYRLDSSGAPKLGFNQLLTGAGITLGGSTPLLEARSAGSILAEARAIISADSYPGNILRSDITTIDYVISVDSSLSPENRLTHIDAALENIVLTVAGIAEQADLDAGSILAAGGAGGNATTPAEQATESTNRVMIPIIQEKIADLGVSSPIAKKLREIVTNGVVGKIYAVAQAIRDRFVVKIMDPLLAIFSSRQTRDIIQRGGTRIPTTTIEGEEALSYAMYDLDFPIEFLDSGDVRTVSNVIDQRCADILVLRSDRHGKSISEIEEDAYTAAFAAASSDTFASMIIILLDHIQDDADESGVGGAFYREKKQLVDTWATLGPTLEFYRQLGYYLYYSDGIKNIFENVLSVRLIQQITFSYTVIRDRLSRSIEPRKLVLPKDKLKEKLKEKLYKLPTGGGGGPIKATRALSRFTMAAAPGGSQGGGRRRTRRRRVTRKKSKRTD